MLGAGVVAPVLGAGVAAAGEGVLEAPQAARIAGTEARPAMPTIPLRTARRLKLWEPMSASGEPGISGFAIADVSSSRITGP